MDRYRYSYRGQEKSGGVPRGARGPPQAPIKPLKMYSCYRQSGRAPETYIHPSDANVVIEAHPSATPRTMPASTSLKKCIPKTMRETAMLRARKNSGPSKDG